MEAENHSDLLEDKRFKEVKKLKKKDVPHRLHWFLGEKDYFSEELLGVHRWEIDDFKRIASEGFNLFEKATDKLISDNELATLGIPEFFHSCIVHSWEQRKKHPFLYGRFDINGGYNSFESRIIEFNADTCSTLPETILWQDLQVKALKRPSDNFNNLKTDISKTLETLKLQTGKEHPVFLGTSFGYIEDVENVNSIIDIAYESGFKPYYSDLERVVFSDEGVFHQIGDNYIQVDVLFKMIPWDWMFNDEPELAKILNQLIINNNVVVLNPPYTAIWQNKKFLAYITKHFPNRCIAETYFSEQNLIGQSYVEKPVYGRLGENINIYDAESKNSTKGDYEFQNKIYQKYYPLNKDQEDYFYQTGIFYTSLPSALNLRVQESNIITEDCEFMSHFILY